MVEVIVHFEWSKAISLAKVVRRTPSETEKLRLTLHTFSILLVERNFRCVVRCVCYILCCQVFGYRCTKHWLLCRSVQIRCTLIHSFNVVVYFLLHLNSNRTQNHTNAYLCSTFTDDFACGFFHVNGKTLFLDHSLVNFLLCCQLYFMVFHLQRNY